MLTGMRLVCNYNPAMRDDPMVETFVLRMTKRDREELDALVAQLSLKATHIARVALRLGFASIKRDPSVIFTAGKPTRGKAPKANK